MVAVHQPSQTPAVTAQHCHQACKATLHPRLTLWVSVMLYSEHGFARLVFHLTEDLYSILDFTGWTNPLSFLLRDPHNTSSKKTKLQMNTVEVDLHAN